MADAGVAQLRRQAAGDAAFIAALRPRQPAPVPAPATVAPAPPQPRAQTLELGASDAGPLHLDLAALQHGRLLIQGASGAGKSSALRRIVECAHRQLTTVVVDPDGEFANLAEHIGANTVAGAEIAADGLAAAAASVRRHRVPLHLDLSDLDPHERIRRGAAFLTGLLDVPREHWRHTTLVAIDEAQLLAPHVGGVAHDAEVRRLGVAALADLCWRGRKRGLTTIVATPRLAGLATSVLSALTNSLLGLNTLDRDVARAADLLGYTYDRAAVMRDLKPGEFYAIGPALCALPKLVRIGATETKKAGGTPELVASAGHARDAARALLRLDHLPTAPRAAEPEPPRGGRQALDAFLLEPCAADAARIVAALRPISPNAATATDLARHLDRSGAAVDAALDLLGRLGAAEIVARPGDRVARLSARLRARLQETPVVDLA